MVTVCVQLLTGAISQTSGEVRKGASKLAQQVREGLERTPRCLTSKRLGCRCMTSSLWPFSSPHLRIVGLAPALQVNQGGDLQCSTGAGITRPRISACDDTLPKRQLRCPSTPKAPPLCWAHVQDAAVAADVRDDGSVGLAVAAHCHGPRDKHPGEVQLDVEASWQRPVCMC